VEAAEAQRSGLLLIGQPENIPAPKMVGVYLQDVVHGVQEQL
jgi:hypothetical protein